MTRNAPESLKQQNDMPRHMALAERMYLLRRGLTLRFVLLALVSMFGLGLVVLVAANGASHLSLLRAYRLEREIDLTRQATRSAFLELETATRRLGYLALDPSRPVDTHVPVEIALERIVVARDLALALGTAETAARLDAQAGAAVALLGRFDAEAGLADGERSAITAELVGMAAELADLWRGTVGTLHISDVQMALLNLIRDQAIAQHRDLDAATDMVIAMLSDASGLSMDALARLDAALIRLQASPVALLAADDAIALPNLAFRTLAETIRDGVIPSLEAVVDQIAAERVNPDVVATWIAQVERADTEMRQVLAEADRIALAHIDARIANVLRDVVIATIGGGLAVLAYVLTIAIIMRRLIAPMSRLRDTLLRLAQGDLRPIEAQNSPFVDLQAVFDALRVFRIDAIRRKRLREERLELTAANLEMHADLKAAAAVQAARLPRPGRVGDLRFFNLFRASRHLGGDSFDHFRLPDGRIVMFQLDVAGHGTASSLVAVAAHTTIKRSLMELAEGQSLVDVFEDINTNWDQDLPYFTAVLIGFDPAGWDGTMVQAGHPYPLLLPAAGKPRTVGEGALPIGVHRDPGYQAQPVILAPGDRLFVFSDGMYEVSNSAGALFGEDRLAAIIGRSRGLSTDAIVGRIMSALGDWAGTADLDDDISLVVMERQS